MSKLAAITRAVGPALAHCELTFIEREPIDVARAAEQHDAYCTALRAAGVSVFTLPAAENLLDAVFVEDAAVVLDEIAIVTRPGIDSRRIEVDAVAAVLALHRRTACIEVPGSLEGGDVLRIGRRLFVGRSTRTNDSGLRQLASIVKPLGYDVVQVGVHGCLHLKTAVTALSRDTLLVNPGWIDTEILDGFRHVAVAADEPFAANTLTLDGIVYISAKWNRTRRNLENAGFTTKAMNISELEKAEAGLTCLSIIFRSGDS